MRSEEKFRISELSFSEFRLNLRPEEAKTKAFCLFSVLVQFWFELFRTVYKLCKLNESNFLGKITGV